MIGLPCYLVKVGLVAVCIRNLSGELNLLAEGMSYVLGRGNGYCRCRILREDNCNRLGVNVAEIVGELNRCLAVACAVYARSGNAVHVDEYVALV